MKQNKIKIYRISTVSHSLSILLKKQFGYLQTKGYDYTLLCSPDERIYNTVIEEKVKFLPLFISRSISPIKDIFELFRLIRYIKKDKPDIIHSHSPKGGLLGMLAGYLTRVDLRIHTVAGLPLVEAKGVYKHLLIFLEKLIYSCAHLVVFNSPKQASFAIKNGWIKSDKVRIIGKGSSNGIDLKYFNPSKEIADDVEKIKGELNLYGKFIFSFVGRIAKSKGIEELIEAFEILQKNHSDLALVLVGMKDDADPINKKFWDLISANKNIHWVDHKNDVRPYFQMCDIFVFPSYREGFPQVLMQACAMKCSIITTDINGANEIIDDRDTGLLISTKSVNEIIIASEELINDKDLRFNLSRKSRKSIEDGFDQIMFWESLNKLYAENLVKNEK